MAEPPTPGSSGAAAAATPSTAPAAQRQAAGTASATPAAGTPAAPTLRNTPGSMMSPVTPLPASVLQRSSVLILDNGETPSPSAPLDDLITERLVREAFEVHEKTTVHSLVRHFRRQLSDPATKQLNRDRFRDIIDRIAEVAGDDDDKHLRLKTEVAPPPSSVRFSRFAESSERGSDASIDTSMTDDSLPHDHKAFRLARARAFLSGESGGRRSTDRGPEAHHKRWLRSAAIGDVASLRQLLIDYPFIVNSRDNFTGYTALHWAAKKGSMEMVDALFTPTTELNARSFGGYTPMHLAYLHNNLSVKDKLVELGADDSICDNGGRRPADLLPPPVYAGSTSSGGSGISRGSGGGSTRLRSEGAKMLRFQQRPSSSSIDVDEMSMSSFRPRAQTDSTSSRRRIGSSVPLFRKFRSKHNSANTSSPDLNKRRPSGSTDSARQASTHELMNLPARKEPTSIFARDELLGDVSESAGGPSRHASMVGTRKHLSLDDVFGAAASPFGSQRTARLHTISGGSASPHPRGSQSYHGKPTGATKPRSGSLGEASGESAAAAAAAAAAGSPSSSLV